MMLGEGLFVNVRFYSTITPLTLAIKFGHTQCTKMIFLARWHFQPEKTSEWVLLATRTALKVQSVDGLEMLIHASLEGLEALVDQKESPAYPCLSRWGSQEDFRQAIIREVVRNGNTSMLDTVLKTYTQYQSFISGPELQGPLLVAMNLGDIPAPRKLLKSGANVNKTAPGGTSPLMAAVGFEELGMVRLVLEFGVDFNKESNSDVLARAISMTHLEITLALLKAGGPLSSEVLGSAFGNRADWISDQLAQEGFVIRSDVTHKTSRQDHIRDHSEKLALTLLRLGGIARLPPVAIGDVRLLEALILEDYELLEKLLLQQEKEDGLKAEVRFVLETLRVQDGHAISMINAAFHNLNKR
ncbi:uncharacterized protein BDZ99DRAFT_223830 [Mytilinidion resinicola]|uniref:Ankyrin n=1 Tax=Mytilinidion resinicola TaxID=574789 RepID=A0A6A6YXP6_9PEZI|nr:uncharacterized protein BDZ99DRAFT_223830 [Mytilinidion resinicola]KAF2813736.1 hypothetical protein BDZ99DRAFT_223830 [Mytilinidion resinicola]